MADIRELDLNLLRALDALLDERSVTRASERLGLTQPAVSGMLTRLRASFGDPLFVRTRRGIVPTARAGELAPAVKQILADIAGLMELPLFDPATASLTVSIAATDYALDAVIVPFIARLRRTAPNIRVAVRPLDEARIIDEFERGDIDLALMTPEAAPPELHFRALFDEHYVGVLREGHPDAPGPALGLARFCALDHVLVSFAGDRFRGVVDTALAAQRLERRVVVTLSSFLALLQLVRSTDLIATVPSRLVAGVPGLATFPPPLAIPGFTKLAVWHARTHRSPAHRWVRAQLAEAVVGPTPDGSI
ncbi:LysR family transcriptional regulator [Ancylobacter sp. WKF20]|uniref:LysR family transcriptional regulator n=1 Tax=Ancylobacter sp. WKF20 TaxID=3039801 RepID=UPI00243446F0|nr:LysR family transcriptional regulator [Ancylobacter sp. WKF20]WGD30576.1 LysR family transcriptional regulator [Ancylobacter sp. WKF20]